MKKPNADVKGRDPKNDWKPDIYGKFIWTDANLFLHQGKSTTGQSLMIELVGVEIRATAAGEIVRPPPPPPPAPPPPVVSYHMNIGQYKGIDPLELADEAIRWLEQQIAIAETLGD